jgi:hypothetical protein
MLLKEMCNGPPASWQKYYSGTWLRKVDLLMLWTILLLWL